MMSIKDKTKIRRNPPGQKGTFLSKASNVTKITLPRLEEKTIRNGAGTDQNPKRVKHDDPKENST